MVFVKGGGDGTLLLPPPPTFGSVRCMFFAGEDFAQPFLDLLARVELRLSIYPRYMRALSSRIRLSFLQKKWIIVQCCLWDLKPRNQLYLQ